jgi:hypothetical protein
MAKMSVKVTVDQATADRARRYSARHGVSISRLVQDFFGRLPLDDDASIVSPITVAGWNREG